MHHIKIQPLGSQETKKNLLDSKETKKQKFRKRTPEV